MRGESARPGKRPLRALSASEKMEAIQRVHEGESKASVARDIGVPESTLRGWCKSEHKIRGMARNSSTPDSEAHSPASSSGANPLLATSNLSSEDEAMGPTSAKKMKLDSLADNGDNGDSGKLLDAKAPKMDYVSSIINSLVASGVRSDNSSILLQQLGLLSSAQSAASLTKNLLSLSAANSLGSSHLGSTAAQAVGLVENGLQYSKSSVGGHSNKRSSSSSSSHISAIAPTTQMDSVSKSGSRKSLPPAAEAPSTPVPASPRKTSESHSGALSLQTHSRNSPGSSSSSGSKKESSSSNSAATRKADEALWMWLAQQQQLVGQHFNPSATGMDGSWFWQWYKQCGFPIMPTSMTATAATTPQQSAQLSTSAAVSSTSASASTSSSSVKKSPSKAKALLDNVLCNNNNENARRSLNASTSSSNGSASAAVAEGEGEENNAEAAAQPQPEATVPTPEEAIEHAEKFFSWLDTCSEPSVTRLQIMQFKYLLDNLKTCRQKTASCKQSRK